MATLTRGTKKSNKNDSFNNVQNKAGQNFPTKNPNFVPPEPKANDIKFNTGTIENRKKVTLGGGTSSERVLDKKEGVRVNTEESLKEAQRIADEEKIRREAEFEFKKTNLIGEMRTAQEAEAKGEAIDEIGSFVPTPGKDESTLPDTAVRVGTSAGSVVGGAVAGAGTGALAGGAVGSVVPGVGTAIGASAGAVVGGIGGALGGLYVKLGLDKKQDTKQAFNDFTLAKAGVSQAILDANNKVGDANFNVQNYNDQWNNVFQTRDRLKLLTQSAIGRDLSKAMDELSDVESFIEDKDRNDIALQQAILNPKPQFVPKI